jgi:hypothetical protein
LTKKQLELIVDALHSSKDNAEKEANLFEIKAERPALIKYLRSELIPKLDEAYKIVRAEYYTANDDKQSF